MPMDREYSGKHRKRQLVSLHYERHCIFQWQLEASATLLDC